MDEAIAPVTQESSQGDTATMSAALDSLGIFNGMQQANDTAASEVESREPANTNAVDDTDPLADDLFADLTTPEGIKAARDRILSEKKKAVDLRRKAHSAHAAAEAREAKFKRTKGQTLQEKQALQSQLGMLNSEIQALRSGDVNSFIQAVGRLSGAADPHKFWRDASFALASGGKVQEQEVAPVPPEIQARLDQLENHVREQGRAVTEQKIAELRHQQLQFAQTSEAHPLLSAYSTDNPSLVDQALTALRVQERERTGRPISAQEACDLLERELSSQYELLQRANSQRGLTGKKEATGSEPDVGRETNALAKPGMSAGRTQTPQSVTTIPASLTAQPAAAKRPMTKREQNEVIAQALPAEFWRNLGF